MNELTNAELAVLSLIAEKPRHGYEVETVIEERNMREWTEIGFSSIYHILRKLARQGFLIGKQGEKEGRGPARTVYNITESGKETLYQNTIKALSEPVVVSNPFEMGLHNLCWLEPRDAIDAIKNYLQGRQDLLSNIRESADRHQPMHLFLDVIFDYSFMQLEAEIKWLQNLILRLEAYYAAQQYRPPK